jgi:hypothetical protein
VRLLNGWPGRDDRKRRMPKPRQVITRNIFLEGNFKNIKPIIRPKKAERELERKRQRQKIINNE